MDAVVIGFLLGSILVISIYSYKLGIRSERRNVAWMKFQLLLTENQFRQEYSAGNIQHNQYLDAVHAIADVERILNNES